MFLFQTGASALHGAALDPFTSAQAALATPVDPRRTVAARFVAEIDAPDPRPGDMMPMAEDAGGLPWGYAFRCPGCCVETSLPLRPADASSPRWTVTAGDPRTGAGLSLSPSIHHAAPHGCGWHGYLRDGVLAPVG